MRWNFLGSSSKFRKLKFFSECWDLLRITVRKMAVPLQNVAIFVEFIQKTVWNNPNLILIFKKCRVVLQKIVIFTLELSNDWGEESVKVWLLSLIIPNIGLNMSFFVSRTHFLLSHPSSGWFTQSCTAATFWTAAPSAWSWWRRRAGHRLTPSKPSSCNSRRRWSKEKLGSSSTPRKWVS